MKLKKILTTMFLLLFLLPIRAAEAPVVPPSPEAETITEQAEPATDSDVAATQDEEASEEEEQSSSRFIPTEQISQDLGVSFPVDI